jgi:hypothetical protein
LQILQWAVPGRKFSAAGKARSPAGMREPVGPMPPGLALTQPATPCAPHPATIKAAAATASHPNSSDPTGDDHMATQPGANGHLRKRSRAIA